MRVPQRSCPNHPTYRGLQEPRTACPYCWRQYLGQNVPKNVDTHMLAKVIQVILLLMEE